MTAAATIHLESRAGAPPGSAAADLLALLEGGELDRARRGGEAATVHDVERVLAVAAAGRGLEAIDLAVLLSPAASTRLEAMAMASRTITMRRFGPTVRLFAPLYLSNECVSVCTYCGFSAGNVIARRTLTVPEVVAEARELASRGIRHVLLVAGEHARIVNKDYLVGCVAALAPFVPSISLEVQVWDADTYGRLLRAGCDGLVVYQETYDRDTYASTHLLGKKRNYEWRLAAPDRAAGAGVRRLGIGALLGLYDDWRWELIVAAAHAKALIRRHWRSEVSIAVPRLRPAAGDFVARADVTDRDFVQAVCALRMCLPDVGISLSTREPAALRDGLAGLGVTTMSAGSHTEPGGYAEPSDAEPQFEISDDRSPADVAAALRARGLDPVWKDWQRA